MSQNSDVFSRNRNLARELKYVLPDGADDASVCTNFFRSHYYYDNKILFNFRQNPSLFHCLRPYRQNLYKCTNIPKARHELRINSGLAFLFLRSFLGSEGKEEKYSLGRSSIRIQVKRNPQ